MHLSMLPKYHFALQCVCWSMLLAMAGLGSIHLLGVVAAQVGDLIEGLVVCMTASAAASPTISGSLQEPSNECLLPVMPRHSK